MCNENINTCGEPIFAPCVRYEKELPPFTKIVKPCVNLEDTTDDIYKIIKDVKDSIPLNLLTRLTTLESNYNSILTRLTALENKNACNLDVSTCFTAEEADPCGQPIINLGQALNYLDNKI